VSEDRQLANRKTLRLAVIVTAGMFCFGFALWPMYNILCDITGFRGTSFAKAETVTALPAEPDLSRTVTITFDATVNSQLAWNLTPAEREMEVHPGKLYETYYLAQNVADVGIVGKAAYNVTPPRSSFYFAKTECFCFTEQTLAAGEVQKMPIRFMLSPDLPEDVEQVTMAYTFYHIADVPEQTISQVQ
jgi:cytochrome c oxidase assembly protein subunit 11